MHSVKEIEFLKQYTNAKGMIVDEVLEDVGSGLRKYKNKIKGYEEIAKKL